MSMHNNEEFLGKNSDELYIQFKGIINKIQKRYSFLELEENEFKSLVLLILDKCLKTYEKNDFISFHTYCFGKLDEYFDQYAVDAMDINKDVDIEENHEFEDTLIEQEDNSYIPNDFQLFCKNLKPLLNQKEEIFIKKSMLVQS